MLGERRSSRAGDEELARKKKDYETEQKKKSIGWKRKTRPITGAIVTSRPEK